MEDRFCGAPVASITVIRLRFLTQPAARLSAARPGRNLSSGATRASSLMRELSAAQPLPADVTVTAAALGGVQVAVGREIFMNSGPGN